MPAAPLPVAWTWEIAVTFNEISLSSLGGGLSAWSQEMRVARREWVAWRADDADNGHAGCALRPDLGVNGVLRWPLWWTLLITAPLGIGWAWRQAHKRITARAAAGAAP
jgi:hypothetical protein